MPERNDALIQTVRLAIYTAIEQTGTAPSSAELARAHTLDTGEVEAAYRVLADGHVIVLEPDTQTIRWAPPFSLVATPFRVHRRPWRADDAAAGLGSLAKMVWEQARS